MSEPGDIIEPPSMAERLTWYGGAALIGIITPWIASIIAAFGGPAFFEEESAPYAAVGLIALFSLFLGMGLRLSLLLVCALGGFLAWNAALPLALGDTIDIYVVGAVILPMLIGAVAGLAFPKPDWMV